MHMYARCCNIDITAILYNDMVHDNADNNDDDNIFLHTILHLRLYANLSKFMWRVGERMTCWTTWPVLSCTDSVWWIWSKRKLTCALKVPMVGSKVFPIETGPFLWRNMFVFPGVLCKFLTSYVSHSLKLPDGALHWQIKFCNWRRWSPPWRRWCSFPTWSYINRCWQALWRCHFLQPQHWSHC